MSDDKKSRFARSAAEIDMRLGDLFGELGNALTEMLDRLDTEGSQEFRRDISFDSGKGPIRAETGIRVRFAGQEAGGGARAPRPVNRPASGRPAPAATAPAAPAPKPVEADILCEDGVWQLVADLPGVDRDGLTLSQDGARLVIRAEGRGRAYESRFDLPAGLSLSDIEVALNNGILELTATVPGGDGP